MRNKRIAVIGVMPVYNESGSIHTTRLEWTDVLRTQHGHASFRFYGADDSSSDHTRGELERVRPQGREIALIF